MKTKRVLDHGEIALLDVMGDDKAIVDAARISYSGAKAQKGVSDRDLMRYLMRHGHHTPFEMVEMKFYVKAPIFVFRQWHRHRTAHLNEMSGRYSELPNDLYRPSTFRTQSKDNKQGSSNGTLEHDIQSFEKAYTEYLSLINKDVAREQARIVLPVSTYSEMYWKCDLRNIFNFLRLRLDSHAQYEIRVYAKAMAQMVRECFPLAYEAFEEYMMNSLTLSATEVALIREHKGTIPKDAGLSRRETGEFKWKLKQLGL